MPRSYVTLSRSDRSPLYTSVFVNATAEEEAVALAVAAAERRRGGRFELVHVSTSRPTTTAEVLDG